MSYFDQMMQSSGAMGPQAMNYAGQQAAQSRQQQGQGGDGFWDKFQGWFEDPGGAAAVSPFIDHMMSVARTPPQFYGMNPPGGGAPLANPGAIGMRGLLQAIMSRG